MEPPRIYWTRRKCSSTEIKTAIKENKKRRVVKMTVENAPGGIETEGRGNCHSLSKLLLSLADWQPPYFMRYFVWKSMISITSGPLQTAGHTG